MLFNSLQFIYGFLPIAYLVFWSLRSKSHRYIWLTITGYVFYGFWNYKFCAIMALSTLVSYYAGLGMLRWDDPKRRRICLVAPIVADLLLLGFFKYANFTIQSVSSALGWFGATVHAPVLDIVLPIGISFYTFHTITYVVDSYRGVITPTRNLFEFSCYVSLFSQLVAGPIVRFRQIESDLEHIDRTNRAEYFSLGWSFFAIGLAEKVLIADSIASTIDPWLSRYAELSTFEAWLAIVGYSYQLYFDFAGYSDMAIGLGYLFGIRIPQNFNSPYKSLSPSDFWRRWHMSLSTCLRDYLYVPMGGSRAGTMRTYQNLMVTMLLGGLWHGANWTFVLWGAYHGALLAVYRAFGTRWDALARPLRLVGTYMLVLVGWVLFRSVDIGMARVLLRKMFFIEAGVGSPAVGGLLGLLGVAGILAHVAPNARELRHEWSPAQALGLAGLFGLCVIRIYGAAPSPFLYFQF